MINNYPYTNFHDLNLDWILSKIQENDSVISTMKTEVDTFPTNYEKSYNITSNRKLSENGNFTGDICNRDSFLTISQIDKNSSDFAYLLSQFADGQTGTVIDGGFFEDSGINKSYNGGNF